MRQHVPGWLLVSGLALFYACSDDSDPNGKGGQNLADSGVDQATGGSAGASGSAGSGGVAGSDACFWNYVAPGCGDQAPDPVCQGGAGGLCITTFCGCDGVTFEGGCQASSVPFAAFGACEGGVLDAGADADACPFLEYQQPGCGANAPQPVCGTGVGDACAQDYCSCEGKTIIGCGWFSQPFAHAGPCEVDAGGG